MKSQYSLDVISHLEAKPQQSVSEKVPLVCVIGPNVSHLPLVPMQQGRPVMVQSM